MSDPPKQQHMKKNRHAIVPAEAPGAITPYIEQLHDEADAYQDSALPRNTERAYYTQWRLFVTWCRENGFDRWTNTVSIFKDGHPAHPTRPAPVEGLRAYLAERARTKKVSTINLTVASIDYMHRYIRERMETKDASAAAKFLSPTKHPDIQELLRGIRRTKGARPERKAAVTIDELQKLVEVQPDTLVGIRNRAMLLIGFMGAFRRSELVAIETKHIRKISNGLAIDLPRSKTDQTGERERDIGLPRTGDPDFCPCVALGLWFKESKVKEGKVWRHIDKYGKLQGKGLSDQTVNIIVKEAAEQAGLDVERFSAHSLRAGFCTVSAGLDRPFNEIMRQTGHRRIETVMMYVRHENPLKGNAASAIAAAMGKR